MFLFSDAKEMKIKRDFFGSASPDSSGDGKSGRLSFELEDHQVESTSRLES